MERRSVGDKVLGLWIRERMKEIVNSLVQTEEEKKQAAEFVASKNWLTGFAKRWELSYRKKTNRKSQSAIRRSLKVRKFHWFAMY